MRNILLNIFRIFIVLIGALSILCCVKEDSISNELRQITLEYNLEYNSESSTKSFTSTQAENRISEVAMIFFNKDDGRQQTHIIKDVTEHNTNGYILIDMPNMPDGDYDVLILGNLKYYLSNQTTQAYLAALAGEDIKAMKQKLKVSTGKRFDTSEAPLPLSGESEVTIYSSIPKTNMSVSFKRAVSRIDLVINENIAPKFNLIWAKVCNFRTQSALFNHNDNLGSIVSGVADTPSVIGDWGVISPATGAQSILSGGLYAFSNIMSGVKEGCPNTTYLMIAGKYGGADSRTTYYRVNIIGSSSIQMLSPNHMYRLTITDVTGDGAPNEHTAAIASELSLKFDFSYWDNGHETISGDQSGNYMIVSSNSVVLGSAAGSSNTFNVRTNGDNSWAWEAFLSDDFSIDKTSDNTGVVITTISENVSKVARTATLTLYNTKNIKLKEIITLVQLSDNPYITVTQNSVDITESGISMNTENLSFDLNINPGDEGLEWRVVEDGTNYGLRLISNSNVGTQILTVKVPPFFSSGIIPRTFKLKFSVRKTGREVLVNVLQPTIPLPSIDIKVSENWITVADRNVGADSAYESIAAYNNNWYGEYFSWINAKKACVNFRGADGSDGWRLPSRVELKGIVTQEKLLKDPDQKTIWRLYDEQEPARFVYFPSAGRYNDNKREYENKGSRGFYWSSKGNADKAFALFFNNSNADPSVQGTNLKTNRLAVRCVKNTTAPDEN